MVIAAGLRASYAAFFETQHIATAPHWAAQWAVGYVVFVVAYALMPTDSFATMTRAQAWSAAVQAIAGIYLVWLYPSFVVVCLLVLVAWQFALLLDLRGALLACAAQIVALALIKCTGATDASFALIIASCAGFQPRRGSLPATLLLTRCFSGNTPRSLQRGCCWRHLPVRAARIRSDPRYSEESRPGWGSAV